MQVISVLIVEDEILVALMLEEVLSDAGFRTIGVYRSGAAALDHLKREPPDVLLLDLVLQGELSGIDLALAVREFWSGPIIFHTSASDTAARRQMSAIENSAVVLKPAEANELIPVIRELLGLSPRPR
jgi:DNA-binding response OmpR family regulator